MKRKKIKVRVGLTGSFGTGKSTVARMFRGLGAVSIDCDQLAHQALARRTPTHLKIRKIFGREILKTNGAIDRHKLARIVFREPGKRKKLESVVHPYVFGGLKKFQNENAGILLMEVPLLFETHFDQKLDRSIVVTANSKNQVKRSRLDPKEVRLRSKAQMTLSQKIKRADFVIDNDGPLSETRKQVLVIWKKLKMLQKRREENIHG